MDFTKMEPTLLMSIVNMKLRDLYDHLDALCDDLDLEKNIIIEKLDSIGYIYSAKHNQFISK